MQVRMNWKKEEGKSLWADVYGLEKWEGNREGPLKIPHFISLTATRGDQSEGGGK